jgi:hypothetical protein
MSGDAYTVICNDDGTIIVNTVTTVTTVDVDTDQTVIVEGDDTQVVNTETETTVIEAEDGSVTISDVGQQGTPAEDDVPLARRVDFVGETLIYRGKAQPGTLDATNGWRIEEITFVGPEEDVEIRWADGVSDFSKVWDDRAMYTYT